MEWAIFEDFELFIEKEVPVTLYIFRPFIIILSDTPLRYSITVSI